MDNLRGFGPFDSDPLGADSPAYASFDEAQEDAAIEPPPVVSGDERRMQVRAYNFWTAQLGEGNYPNIEELDPESVEDFRGYSVLLDFTSGIENPSIQYLGDELRRECGLDADIGYLDQVPPRSLLSRITDHYLQIIANRAPKSSIALGASAKLASSTSSSSAGCTSSSSLVGPSAQTGT
jgi:hypothetical protein